MKTAVSLKVMAESKVDGVSKTTQFQVDPRIIEIEQGFNAREIDRDHVESMKAAKKSGAQFPPLFVRVDAGRVIVVDGHHRLQACLELIEEGIDYKRIDCIQFRGNDADRIALMLTTAQGKALTPLEMGIQYKKLINFGWTAKEISEKTGRGKQQVDDFIRLADAPIAVQNMIREKQVSSSTAIAAVKEHGDKSGEVLQGEHKKAVSMGKAKVTKKTISGHIDPIICTARAEALEECADHMTMTWTEDANELIAGQWLEEKLRKEAIKWRDMAAKK